MNIKVSIDENTYKVLRDNPHSMIDENVGYIQIGAMSFELVVRVRRNSEIVVDIDCYTLGINSGYGETAKGIPYDYDVCRAIACPMSTHKEVWIGSCISLIMNYIWRNGKQKYAEEELLTWENVESNWEE